MVVEALRAARNERDQFARGGVEPANDVYRVMRVAYPASFAAMLAEGTIGGHVSPFVFGVGATVFAFGKLIKWSAITALGRAWTFRVVVVPGDPLISGGPYRFFRHPNYLGVVGELAGVALMAGARATGPVAIVGFGALMWRRITVERAALAAGGPPRQPRV
jgi:methyltransferase